MSTLATIDCEREEFQRFVAHVASLLQILLAMDEFDYSAGVVAFDDGRVEITFTPVESGEQRNVSA